MEFIHKAYTELLTAREKLLLVIRSNSLLNLKIIAFPIQEILLVHFHIFPFILHLESLKSILFYYIKSFVINTLFQISVTTENSICH